MADKPDLMVLLPEIYQKDLLTAVVDVEAGELGQFNTTLADLICQLFVETATWGLDIWEEELGLISYEGKPIEHRRSRIISKLRGMGTATISLIKNVAESYTYGTVQVIEHNAEYYFVIKFAGTLGIPPNLDDLKEAIEEIKPAHLGVEYEIVYNTYGMVKAWGKTYGEIKALGLTYADIRTYKPV